MQAIRGHGRAAIDELIEEHDDITLANVASAAALPLGEHFGVEIALDLLGALAITGDLACVPLCEELAHGT